MQSVTRWSTLLLSPMPDRSLVRMLARSFLAGDPAIEQIVARGSRTLGNRWRWLPFLAQRYIKAFTGRTRPRQRDVVRFFLEDRGFQRALKKYSHELFVEEWLNEPQQMQPVGVAETWDVPSIESTRALAEWLGVKAGELEWFADLKGLACRKISPRLGHYHYRILAKGNGNIRLIEAPKLRLKEMQRKILTGILEKVPAHSAANGFVKGRSIKTFVTPHVAKRVVLRMDLQDFFPSFRAARIQTFFRTLGYPESVADLLGGICTNATPHRVWRNLSRDFDPSRMQEARVLYSRPHLPQGAPTSPALANLSTYRVDCRLAGLAKCLGAEYARYADDLAFSGGQALERRIERLSTHVAAILLEEGFTVNHRKTRIMRQGVRQHLVGIVVNQHANVIRSDFDLLKATLTNCERFGPESQNRDSRSHFRLHLDGRVAFVEMINPTKGAGLRRIFERIRWQ
jgi:RNA-directed DNA polymerase